MENEWIDVFQCLFNDVSTSDTAVVSMFHKVENPMSDFVSFSTSDQVLESLFLYTLLKKARETTRERQSTGMGVSSKDSMK